MIKITKQIFQSSPTAQGGWIDISGCDLWSVQIDQAEGGATFTVEVRNDVSEPSAAGFDLNAAGQLISAGTGFFGPKVALQAHWLRVTKTAGGSPILSTGLLFGKTYPE